MSTEAAGRADFSIIRYAQVWEDADVLLDGLDVRPGNVCLSIASAGDNALSMLTRSPKKVIALDLNPAQIACLELRVAAYRRLQHGELLELSGSRPSNRRVSLYRYCREDLSEAARQFWDARLREVAGGIGSAGKFERYFALFRRRVLPWVHSRRTVNQLLAGGPIERRRRFYRNHWETWRWRAMFKLFFSRLVMGRLGRDPAFFQYVEGDVGTRILARSRHALAELDPAANPYLQWILTGAHVTALPHALREENFDPIRQNLDRLEWRLSTIEEYLSTAAEPIDCYNISDIFEYMSEANYHSLLKRLVAAARPGARLLYWNMLVPRSRPATMADALEPLEQRAKELHLRDKAFFYSRLVIERVTGAACR
jgi:S-adenosylmethionine-diacylglycerol 3-amino-3-carboxypropyl transferase